MKWPFRCILLVLLSPCAAGAAQQERVSLFNGRDLAGWESCLGVPPGDAEPLGRGRDPLGVFRVVTVDGEPAIRISGEVLGGLVTLGEYGNYHLELEFKWGERRFAPARGPAAGQRPTLPRGQRLRPRHGLAGGAGIRHTRRRRDWRLLECAGLFRQAPRPGRCRGC